MVTWLPRLGFALLGGFILSLEAPPLNLHWLQWVGLVPMLWVMRADSQKSNGWLAFAYGLMGTAAIFWWIVGTITLYSNITLIPAVLILCLFSAVFGSPYVLLWLAVHRLRARVGSLWVLLWPCLWVLVEFTAMHVFLFPFNHGVGQFRVPLVWQVSGITGVWGLTWLVVFGNAVLGEWIYRWREGDKEPPGFWALGFASTLLAVVLYGSWRYEQVERELREAPSLRVAQFQSHMDMVERLDIGARAGFEEWMKWTTDLTPGVVDLVVWPEGACPYSLNERPNKTNRVRDGLQQLAIEKRFDLLVGGGTQIKTPEGREVYNSVYVFQAGGGEVGHYDKMVPLPFGEYLPLGDYLPGLADMIGGIGDFRAGSDPTVMTAAGLRTAAPICYEAILPGTCRSFEDPELIVNVTNDAWFGPTAASQLHGMLAVSRATELGVPLIRSTYSGISMVAEPHGVIHSETGLFESVQRLTTVRTKTFPTLYARFGDWFVGACGLGLLLGLVLGRRGAADSEQR